MNADVCVFYSSPVSSSYFPTVSTPSLPPSLELLFSEYVRFVWAVTSRGPIVLMCSDLTVKPEQVLALYCRRIRIEVLFDTLKNKLGAFRFHFWSRYLPRHSRQPKSNKQLKSAPPEHVDKIQ